MAKGEDKQAAFVQEYLIDLNATQAAIRAGYSPKTAKQQGSRLLTKVDIQEAIAKAKEERSERVQVSQDYVLNGLMENFERSMQHTEIKNSDGQGTGEYKYEGSVANKSLELMGRHLGMFTDRTENVNTNYVITDQPEGQSEEEWLENNKPN